MRSTPLQSGHKSQKYPTHHDHLPFASVEGTPSCTTGEDAACHRVLCREDIGTIYQSKQKVLYTNRWQLASTNKVTCQIIRVPMMCHMIIGSDILPRSSPCTLTYPLPFPPPPPTKLAGRLAPMYNQFVVLGEW